MAQGFSQQAEATQSRNYQDHFRADYKVYSIQQGTKVRQIEEPKPSLKRQQKRLLSLLEQFPLHSACKCKKGSSISINAAEHEGATYLLKTDIKGCYQAIRPWHIYTAIHEYASSLCSLINRDTLSKCFYLPYTSSWESWLPTGAPTSPILCNIALTPIDYEIQQIADIYNMRYTRYLDDMILSTIELHRHWEVIDLVNQVVERHKFQLNKKKSVWLTQGKDKLVVTGVRLSERKVSRELYKQLKRIIKTGKLTEQTKGYLAFVKSIDRETYERLLGELE